MSLDFCLYAMRETRVFDSNITHNMTVMWREAGVYDALYNSHEKTAGELLSVLQDGLSKMRRNRLKFEEMDPSNGWGDYETAVKFLENVVAACDTNPDAKVWISK